jgi:L-arabinokinase
LTVLVAYVSGHGYGHLVRLCEVLRVWRARQPEVGLTVVGAVPERLLRREIPGPFDHRPVACDVGLVQRDALEVDEEATARRCAELDDRWDARADEEAAFLRAAGARLVFADIPALAFEAAARAGVPSVGMGNFSWDWVYRHLAARHPSLQRSADLAAAAYRKARLLLELPFTGDLRVFARRERVGFVARSARVVREEVRRRLGISPGPFALVSFGGVGFSAVGPEAVAADRDIQYLFASQLHEDRLDALGLRFVDVVGAADVVVSKPGYGIVTDCIAAGARLVYTERGDFPEYPVMVREMPAVVACLHLSGEDLRAGRLGGAVRRALALPLPPRPDLDGAARAAERLAAELQLTPPQAAGATPRAPGPATG